MGKIDRLIELENRVAESDGDERSIYAVEWADAAPDERPRGMAWDPDAKALTFDFWDAQQDALSALEADVDLVGLLGGYRSGKSVTGARWLLTQALEHPGTRHLAMGIDFAKAQGSTYRVLFEQLPPVDVRTDLITSAVTGPERSPIVDDYHRSEHRLTLTNGSIIKLGAADVWNRYAGDEYSAVWMDEPSHYSDLHAILEMVGSRLTASAGPKKQFWTLTGNGYNEAWEVLEERQDADGAPLGLDIEVVTASVRENPYLAPEDVERLERQFAATGKEEQALEGGFTVAEGLVYSNFRRDTHVVDHAEAADRVVDGWRVFGYDAGWNDPRVLVELGKTPHEQLVVLDEFYRPESHVEDAIRWLDREDKPNGRIYAEHEPSELDKFRRAGYDIENAEKSIDAGIAEVRKRLEPDGNIPTATGSGKAPPTFSWDDDGDGGSDGSDPPDRVGLLITGRCENLIREFLSYREEDVGRGRAQDHALDALRYACMGTAGPTKTVRRKGYQPPSKGTTPAAKSRREVKQRGREAVRRRLGR